MNIVHLKYAVEIARTGSLNKAAENLYMAQPNLSRAIKELEADLGIAIFERSSRGMVATPDGEEFLRYAKKILEQVDEVEAVFKQGLPRKQHFSVSVPRASYIAEAFARFSKQLDPHEPYELFYKETNAMRAIKNILQADYHLGVIRYAEDYDRYFKESLEGKGLAYELITTFSYVLIMSQKHPLADQDAIRFSDLKPFTEIAHADPFVPSLPFSVVRKEELTSDFDRRIYVFERASQFELLSENTDTFMWVSPVPDDLLKRYGLVQKSCADNKRRYKDVLIYKKEYCLSALDKKFITELCNTKRKYVEKSR